MAKYGKKSVISEDLKDYSIMIAGTTGTGKTTTITEIAEKLYGEDGYLLLDMGDEDGVEAIEGVNYEDCKTYKKFEDVCKDIAKNKEKDYPELKLVIFDTADALLKITEAQAIADWNQKNQGKQGFVPAKSKNAIEGGFNAPFEVVFEMIYKYVRLLKKAGVGVWYTAHQKPKDMVDPYTEKSYRVITSKMENKYFDDFITKLHVVGMIVEDKGIEEESTGRKDIKNKEIKVNRQRTSSRKIIFRDPNVNSKSRFKYIVPEINLEADEFIKAIQDAIKKEKKAKADKTLKKAKPLQATDGSADFETDSIDGVFEEEVLESIDYETEVTNLFKASTDKELKAEVRNAIKEHGKISDVPTEVLKELYNKLK